MAHLMRRATHRVTATGHMLQRGSSLPSCRRLQGWAAAAAATPAQVCRDKQSRSAPVCGHFYKMLISLNCGLFTLLKNLFEKHMALKTDIDINTSFFQLLSWG